MAERVEIMSRPWYFTVLIKPVSSNDIIITIISKFALSWRKIRFKSLCVIILMLLRSAIWQHVVSHGRVLSIIVDSRHHQKRKN